MTQPQKTEKIDICPNLKPADINAKSFSDQEKSKKLQDSLLASFSFSQKQYIIEHLYPEISKAFVHFISEA